MTAPTLHSVPAVGRARKPKLPVVAERPLANGLRALAVRRPAVPRVEVRLVMPVGTAASPDGAVERVLAETMLSGTGSHDAVALGERLQGLGASLAAGASTDDLTLGGSTLASTLDDYLDLLAEVLTDSRLPDDEVRLQRDRVAQEMRIVRSQPASVAHEAVLRRLNPDHPYGRPLPTPEAVDAVDRKLLKSFAGKRLRPGGALLVAVGDFKPERFLDKAEAALSEWTGRATGKPLPAPPPPVAGPIRIVDRPGAVQTNIRVVGPALTRMDPEYPALALANIVYGGYFSSRLVDNIREDKGYTYSPRSGVEHRRAASYFSVSADVATEVTAAALNEITYELARMATVPVTLDELGAAKRYLRGSLALSSQTQAGLAAYLVMLSSIGIGVEYLRDMPAAVDEVTPDEVLAVSRRFLAPSRLVTVMVGDAARIRDEVETLGPVEVVEAP